ncbi:MAG: hypothetical protein GY749_35255 [Desulfobacteraceae bacterium]|nr:hypothetical protein [Desulfobacteraceae bacterium]
MRDGDTTGSDRDDLFLTLDEIQAESLKLNGFPHGETVTATNKADISDMPELGYNLAGLFSQPDSISIGFYITDRDVGGNKLFFSPDMADDYRLEATFVQDDGRIHKLGDSLNILIVPVVLVPMLRVTAIKLREKALQSPVRDGRQ